MNITGISFSYRVFARNGRQCPEPIVPRFFQIVEHERNRRRTHPNDFLIGGMNAPSRYFRQMPRFLFPFLGKTIESLPIDGNPKPLKGTSSRYGFVHCSTDFAYFIRHDKFSNNAGRGLNRKHQSSILPQEVHQ